MHVSVAFTASLRCGLFKLNSSKLSPNIDYLLYRCSMMCSKKNGKIQIIQKQFEKIAYDSSSDFVKQTREKKIGVSNSSDDNQVTNWMNKSIKWSALKCWLAWNSMHGAFAGAPSNFWCNPFNMSFHFNRWAGSEWQKWIATKQGDNTVHSIWFSSASYRKSH